MRALRFLLSSRRMEERRRAAAGQSRIWAMVNMTMPLRRRRPTAPTCRFCSLPRATFHRTFQSSRCHDEEVLDLTYRLLGNGGFVTASNYAAPVQPVSWHLTNLQRCQLELAERGHAEARRHSEPD